MKIKSTIAVAAAAGSAFAPGAQAADLPVKAPAKVVADAWSWTGFYVGGHLGYAWQKNPTSGAYFDGGTNFPFNHSTDPKGFLGGAQIGYNWQTGNLVFGVEADISELSGGGSACTRLSANQSLVTTQNNAIKWAGTVRGRVGFAVMPRTMIYGTGGFAYGKVNFSQTEDDDSGNEKAAWQSSKIKTGYAAGGGIEHAVMDHVTVRVEGLYIDLGSTTLNTQTSGTCNVTCQPVTFSNKATMVRGGVNVKF